jgi:murein DD-endopeptidase MepM/ murein hydrolase activator NlpD
MEFKMLKRSLTIGILIGLLFVAHPAVAQTPIPGPVYIVQPGDTLSSIAARFNLTIEDLMAANNLSNPNQLDVGQQLVIPGLEGISGVLDTELVHFGDTFRSFERRTQISPELLRKLNHLVSPSEFYVGASMIVLKQDNTSELTKRITPGAGESLLELSVQNGTDPWTVASLNGLNGTWDGLPGEVLYSTGATDSANSDQGASGLPSAFVSADIPTLPMIQGGTVEILVHPSKDVTLTGTLVDYPLHFFPMGDGRMVALQGIHAQLDPGVYPLRLDATLPDGTKQSFEQSVLIESGNYPKESLSVPTELIDPAITGPEDERVKTFTAPVTSQKYWDGIFSLPVYVPSGQEPCIYDWFGRRRSFNGSDYIYFHSGIDYGVCFEEHPFDIYAAAPGTVVFAGPLEVRGNATFIDHGWGIYTAYFHQKEIDVSVGQQVQAGQLIGQIGATGRVTGPHLHFEVWVNGIQVDPLDWLNHSYP